MSSQPINTVFLRALRFVFKLLDWHSCIYCWLFNFVSFWTDEGLTVRQAGALGQKQGQGSPPSHRSLTHIGDEERKTRGSSDPGTGIQYLHQQNEHLFRWFHSHICIPSVYFCSCTATTPLIWDGLEGEISHGTHRQLLLWSCLSASHGFMGSSTALLSCTSPMPLVSSCLCHKYLTASRTFHSHTQF